MRILICCNAGMSSSIIMQKMRDAAAKRNMELTCEAVPNAGISDEIGKWDVCLVGPQLVYAVNNIKSILNIPVASIEPRFMPWPTATKPWILRSNWLKNHEKGLNYG